MNPDAAIFARLTQQGPALQPDPAEAAHRMTEAAQELTSLIREASACVSELRLGRQGAVMRLPILLARAEDAVAEQHRCSHILARAFADPA
jgi:hypothetical protein